MGHMITGSIVKGWLKLLIISSTSSDTNLGNSGCFPGRVHDVDVNSSQTVRKLLKLQRDICYCISVGSVCYEYCAWIHRFYKKERHIDL